MNVLAITSSYPRYEGDPTAPFVESIVRCVAARGHTVHLVLPETQGWDRPSFESGVHYHPYRYSPVRSWTPWGYSQSLEGGVSVRRNLYALAPAVFASASRKCRSVARQHAVDVVHAHWLVPNGLIGALSAPKRGAPLVVTLHGSDVAVAERSAVIGRAARWALPRAAAVTAPSDDLLVRVRALGASRELVRIPYGVQVVHVSEAEISRTREHLGLRPGDVLVAGVGRLIPVKGFDYLVESIALAATRYPELRLVLVGDGAERGRLEDLTGRSGVRERVTFAGMVSPERVPSYLAAADIVVVPSVRHEGFVDGLPNVALEALAAGKPLVATGVGGLPELIRPGETGLLIEERDSAALAHALESLAKDALLRRRLGEAGRAFVAAEASWDSVAERFEAVYESALPSA